MFLSASEIQDLVRSGELLIDPFLPKHFKPASYILRLGNRWRKWFVSSEPIDMEKSVDTERLLSPIITSDDYVLSNTEFCLAATIEKISLPPNLVGIVAPLSHISRWGLSVNLGSLIVSPKFGATTPTGLTLELVSHNPSPLKLKAGLPICHLAFIKVTPCDRPRPLDKSIYEGRETPSGPFLSEEWLKNEKEVKICVAEQLLGKKQRSTIEKAAIELCNKIKTDENTRKSVWPLLKNFNWDRNPSLELLPLDRIGSEPGKSGVKVLSGRFYVESVDVDALIPSKQLIVKISPDPDDVDKIFAEKKYKELIEEWKSSEKAKDCFDEAHFARPFKCYNDQKTQMAVLWAPCSSPDSDYNLQSVTNDWKYGRIKDINMYLSVGGKYFCTKSRSKMVHKIITAIRYLEKAHNFNEGNNSSDTEKFVQHYKWELRGWDDSEWAKKWRELWGVKDKISDSDGNSWPNPVNIYEHLKTLPDEPLRLGYVHGDLHPHNIVFTHDNEVKIIDFGWTRPLQHIVKDFVLLEANLYFMTLPQSCSAQSLLFGNL